jgi:hypothetical protein
MTTSPTESNLNSHTKPNKSNSQRWSCLIIPIVLVLVLGCLISGLGVIGWMDINQSPLEVSELVPFFKPQKYQYSTEQQNIKDQLGLPDSFTILFYEDEFGGGSTRLETWIYSEIGQSYTWVNGDLDRTESFDPVSGEVIPAPYQPDQFTAYLSLKNVIGATGIDGFMLVPLENELLPGGEIYFADQLSFGLKNGELLYAEAVGFVSEETTQETAQSDGSEIGLEPTNDSLTPSWPNVPMVFASDRDAFNYEECRPDNSCSYHVFYNPASLEGSAQNLSKPLGFASAFEPVLSPNGNKVAFSAFVDGEQGNHVYIVNVDGSGLKKVTQDSFTHGHPSWSPDSSQLVVMSRPISGNYFNLFIIDLNSDETRQLTEGQVMDRFPDWSPDGDLIAFHTNRIDPDPSSCWPNCETGLYVVDVQSGQDGPIKNNGEVLNGAGIAWSPNGRQLAYHSNQNGSWDIFIIDLDSTVSQLTDDSGDELFPSWSPDGKFIAYEGDTSTGNDIGVTPADQFDPVYYTGHGANDTMPDW